MNPRNRIRKGLAALALVACGVSTPLLAVAAQEEKAQAVMEEAEARYRSIDAFCAGFEQSLFVPLLDETTTSRGILCQEKPNFFAMRFTDPEGDILLADGEFFWIYYPSTDPRQVIQFEMGAQPGGVDFQREFLDGAGEKYRMEFLGEEDILGRRTNVIGLEPLEPAGFQRARIWLALEGSLILQARIEMENGSVRRVTLSDIQLDPSPDPERFRFTPPPGTQVIRRR